MTELERMNDQLRQRAHADQARSRTQDRRLTPEQREQKQLESLIKRVAEDAVNKAISRLIIHSGQNIQFSGSGYNITGDVTIPQPEIQTGQLVQFEFCDGGSGQVEVFGYIAPP